MIYHKLIINTLISKVMRKNLINAIALTVIAGTSIVACSVEKKEQRQVDGNAENTGELHRKAQLGFSLLTE